MNPQTNLTRRVLTGLVLASLLSACGLAAGDPTATPLPEDDALFNPVISATGIVVPARWTTLSVGSSGHIGQLPVEVGDRVEQGDLLLALDGQEALAASLAAAELEVVSAQQALDSLVESADLARALAEQELANARDALHDAEYMHRVRQQGNRASTDTIDAAEARLVLAEDEVDEAKSVYDSLSGRSEDNPVRAQALRNLANARADRDSAKRALNWYTGSPTDIEQSQLEADVAVAEARVAEGERTLARMQSGPDQRQLEAAEARLTNAQAQAAAARAALAETELRAPFAGTVAELMVREQEWVMPGVPVMVFGDLAQMQIETTDLNEIDAARVNPGDTVAIIFDALPDLSLSGTVTQVSPKASTGGGVNYTAIIQVEELPATVRWGMTAFVDVEVAP
jgi:multidrug resistance efflux pump